MGPIAWKACPEFGRICHSSPLDAVFTGLYLQGACLQLASLEHVCNSSLSLLAMFTTLTTCNLHSHHEEVDLQALSVLQQMVDLTIVQGQFSNLDTLAHLTHLQMQDCVATCNADCKSASSLLHINMDESAIVRFHEHGIAACCHLKVLRLQTGEIEAVRPSEHLTFGRQDIRVPESLTALTELVVQSRVKNRQLCFEWLSQLTSLRSLHVNASTDLVLPQCLSTLSGLTHMELANMLERPGKTQIAFDWAAFVSLKNLKFYGSIALSTDLGVVASVSKLRRISFQYLVQSDQCTTSSS